MEQIVQMIVVVGVGLVTACLMVIAWKTSSSGSPEPSYTIPIPAKREESENMSETEVPEVPAGMVETGSVGFKTDGLQQAAVLLAKMIENMDFFKKSRVILDYDPERRVSMLHYYRFKDDGPSTEPEGNEDITLDESEIREAPEGRYGDFRYSMHRAQNGDILIAPMNGDGYITIHGEKDAEDFIDHLQECE